MLKLISLALNYYSNAKHPNDDSFGKNDHGMPGGKISLLIIWNKLVSFGFLGKVDPDLKRKLL